MTYVLEQPHLDRPEEPGYGVTFGMTLVFNKKVGDVYHRVWKDSNGHFLHVLGGQRDPRSGSAASLLVSPVGTRLDIGLDADTSGRYPAGTLAVARQITHHRVRRAGLGTTLMALVVKYHGHLLLDKTNSAGVERIFEKLSDHQKFVFRVHLAQRVTSVTAEQYVDPTHTATERHVVEFISDRKAVEHP